MGFFSWLFGKDAKQNFPEITPDFNRYGERTGITPEEFQKLREGVDVSQQSDGNKSNMASVKNKIIKSEPKPKVPCKKCGKQIFLNMANLNNGLCLTCTKTTVLEEGPSVDSRFATIEELGNTPSYESANELLKLAKEWAEEKEQSDDPNIAAMRTASLNMFNNFMDEQGKPGPPLSMEKVIQIGRKTTADAAKSIPQTKVGPVPIQLIGEALARIGEPSIKASERWLSIKVHPIIAKVLLTTGENMGGDSGINLVKRVAGGHVDIEIKRIAEQTLTRITFNSK